MSYTYKELHKRCIDKIGKSKTEEVWIKQPPPSVTKRSKYQIENFRPDPSF